MVKTAELFLGRHFQPVSHGCDERPRVWGPGARTVYSLHYVFRGKGWVEVNGQRFAVDTGQSFLIVPQIPTKYYPDPASPWGYQWVDIAGDDARALMEQTAFSPAAPVSPRFPAEAVVPLFRGVAEADSPYRAVGSLFLLYDYYFKNHPSPHSLWKKPSYAEKAVSYIQANAHRPLPVSEIARHLNISRAHLYRAFETELSTSPGAYLTEYRIRQACELLKQTSLPVKVIAFSLGFENPLYFTQVFTRKRGMSPRRYRLECAGS